MQRKKQDDEIPEENFKLVDMTDEMKTQAYRIAQKALQKYSIEKDIAQYIKSEFDKIVFAVSNFLKQYGQHWHCIVGRSFGSFVTHESKHYVYFYINEMSFLLYRFG